MIRRSARSIILATVLTVVGWPFGAAAVAQVYFPGASGGWERRSPEQVGTDPALLEQAIEFARSSETDAPRDLALSHALSWNREPFDAPVGPLKTRGPQTGIIVRDGYIVAEWGDPWRVDMIFSVTKSFLSSTVGVPYDRGLIRAVDEPVRDCAPFFIPAAPATDDPIRGPAGAPVMLFESEHNRKIT